MTVPYVTECAARTLWHRDTVRGVGTGGLRPRRPAESRREGRIASRCQATGQPRSRVGSTDRDYNSLMKAAKNKSGKESSGGTSPFRIYLFSPLYS
eukprot:42507-Pleurochrysis_carterae.AAC.3